MLDSCKIIQKQSEAFHTFLWQIFRSLKRNFIAYRSSKVSDCIFEIHQLWHSGFTRVYSNSCCSCSFEAEIIKISQPSYNMYSNNITNFQESTTILKALIWLKGNLSRLKMYSLVTGILRKLLLTPWRKLLIHLRITLCHLVHLNVLFISDFLGLYLLVSWLQIRFLPPLHAVLTLLWLESFYSSTCISLYS